LVLATVFERILIIKEQLFFKERGLEKKKKRREKENTERIERNRVSD
jgi:hypothetical protein